MEGPPAWAAKSCDLCPPCSSEGFGEVTLFPIKAPKKKAREEHHHVLLLSVTAADGQEQFLLQQRPLKGLLAGMWEFPSMLLDPDGGPVEDLVSAAAPHAPWLARCRPQALGTVEHVFSHIHATYHVHCSHGGPQPPDTGRWLSRDAIAEEAVSTNMKKVLAMHDETCATHGAAPSQGRRHGGKRAGPEPATAPPRKTAGAKSTTQPRSKAPKSTTRPSKTAKTPGAGPSGPQKPIAAFFAKKTSAD